MPLPCGTFIVQSYLAAADRTGALSGIPLNAISLYFKDYSQTLVSAALSVAPFPSAAAWTNADTFGHQDVEGGARSMGTIESITTTSAGTPEPGTAVLLLAGLSLCGVGRRSQYLKPRSR